MWHPLMAAQAVLGLALAVPWLVLAMLLVGRTRQRAVRLVPWAALPALLAALLVPEDTVLRLPGSVFEFGMDAMTRVFLLPAALLWGLSGWFALGWIREPAARVSFAGFWLVAMAANLGLILARDLLVFYTGFAVMTFAAYGLVVHEGTASARRAGRWYLALMLVGELCLFTAVALLTMPREFAVSAPWLAMLFGVGFGMKLGVLGLHSWLPKAHPVAPVPASAVLSGVMIKAGMLGWWRMVQPTSAELAAWGLPLLMLGLAGAFYGVLMGLPRRDPKTVLAWSSVSQMGLMVMLAGIALLEPAAVASAGAGIAWLVVHHGLAKGALFLGVGLLATGTATARRLAWLLLWLPALALAGAPFTSGALAKTALDRAVARTVHGSWLDPALMLTTLASTLLMARLLFLSGRLCATAETDHRLWFPWLLLLGLLLGLPWWGPWLMGDAVLVRVSPWPVVAALVLAVVVWRWHARLPSRFPRPGRGPVPRRRARLSVYRPLVAARWEQRLHRWPVVGRTVMFMMLALIAVLWLSHRD